MGNCFSQQQSKLSKDLLGQLGVSVYHLQHVFLEKVRRAGLDESAPIYKVEDLQNYDSCGIIRTEGADVICPVDGRIGASYVHSIEGVDHVGPATIMLSYGWGYKVGDIIDTLVDYCSSNKLDPKRSYCWICCLCNNQHRVVENKKNGKVIPFEEFRSIFFGRVTGIGHILAMMAPWDQPLYLTRIWCVYELFVANEENCQVTIAMPPREKKSLVDTLRKIGGVNDLYHALATTNVERAEASEKSDLDTILALVRAGPGYTAFNVKVNELIRAWVVSAIHEAVQDMAQASNNQEVDMNLSLFLHQVANIFASHGDHTQALEMWEKSLAIVQTAHSSEHPEIAPRLNGMGNSLREKNDLDGALNAFSKALAIFEAVGDYQSIAVSLNNIGYVLEKKGLLDEALEVHKKCVFIRVDLLGQKNDSLIAKSYGHIGAILRKKGELDEALKMQKLSLEIEENVNKAFHPSIAVACSNVGNVLADLGRYQEALELYQKSFEIREKIIGMDNHQTAQSYGRIGILLRNKGDFDEALKVMKKSISMHESAGGSNVSAAFTYNNIGIILRDKGQLDEAMKMYDKVMEINQSLEKIDQGLLGVTYNNKADIMRRKGKLDEAMALIEKSLETYQSAFGIGDVSNAIPYKTMGLVLCDKGETEKGLELLNKALTIRVEKMGMNHVLTKQIQQEIDKIDANNLT